MTPLEAYKTYTALNLHFKSKSYDYFEYKGAVRASASAFERLPGHEQRAFYTISTMREPKTYLIGNVLFNPNRYIKYFDEDHYLKYRTYLTNGSYLLKQDLMHLKSPFGVNFTIESEYDIPYIAKLLVEDKISLHTACILQYLTKWADKCHSPIIDDVLFQVRKSYRFFKLNEVEVKGMIIDHYKEKVEA